VNLSEKNISNVISFALQSDESSVSTSSQNRVKHQLLDHIYSGIDVILITCSKQETGSLFLQQCFNDNSDQIRTIFLNSNSFPKEDSGTNNQAHDLSMISAVIYESIHLDTHFAIIVDDADQLPIQVLNELIKLALAINSSKNNVNFIFSGGPDLLGVVQQVSDITRLGIAHCSLDEITEEDIAVYINEKQSEFMESKKLKFNKYALKKISTHANGSLHKASTLLEWCREYALHTGNFKITVGFIDEILRNPECSHLLSNYPPADFSFTASVKSEDSDEKDESVEFSKQNIVQSKQSSIDEVSRTVYIDKASDDTDEKEIQQENIYEKVMTTPTGDVVAIDGTEIMSVTISDNNTSIVSSETIVPKQESSIDEVYEDTYHIEALKDINSPLSPTYADEDTSPAAPMQLAKASGNANSSAFLWTVFILSLLIGTYYLFATNIISYNDVRAYIGTIISSSTDDEPATPEYLATTTMVEEVPAKAATYDDKSQKIAALLELAESQINQKKLSTPPSDNALETYRLILKSHPNNEQALAGIRLIKKRYQTWAELDIKDGNSKRAIYFLQRAIDIAPDQEVLNLLADLQ
jgi:hypothetical protein